MIFIRFLVGSQRCAYLAFALGSLSLTTIIQSVSCYDEDGWCGTASPNWRDVLQAEQAEREMFGKTANQMTRNDFSKIAQRLFQRNRNLAADKADPSLYLPAPFAEEYQMVDIPIVFHVLPNVKANASAPSPSLTDLQMEYAMNQTNKVYNIYDRATQTSVQYMSFVMDQKVVHTDFMTDDGCRSLGGKAISSLLESVEDWEFKMHILVCTLPEVCGFTILPPVTRPNSLYHNLIRTNYQCYACYDENGNFLCEFTDGQQISHTLWNRVRSIVLPHEIGHSFGLFHTFQYGCFPPGDGVSDTPPESTASFLRSPRDSNCPGMLPYDKDRDLFDSSLSTTSNTGANNATCGSEEDVCPSGTCASCCIAEKGIFNGGCPVLTQDEAPGLPLCCEDETPSDTCRFRKGIDPVHNIMTYSHDICLHELTPGQMVRMMAMTRRWKPNMYCNYANVLDERRCRRIQCASTATSPNCVRAE